MHVHLVLQFCAAVDKTVASFEWEGRRPNVSSEDYLGEGLCSNTRFLQHSVDRGFFYVFADKLGTQKDELGKECVEGNHSPCWVKAATASRYVVPGKWPWNLWRQHKLSRET